MTRKNRFSGLIRGLAVLILAALIFSAYQYNRETDSVAALSEEIEGAVSSRCIYMTDAFSGKVYCEKNSDLKVPVASLTKIMTALVALENLDSLDAEFTFTADIIEDMVQSNASVAGFSAGETVSARDMIYGMMLPSGGDAAIGLARLVAGDEESYTKLMNRKAKELDMKNTCFSDVTGLDDQNSYSTVRDMSTLFAYALENEEFYNIVTTDMFLTRATPEHPNGILLTATLSEGKKEYSLENTVSGGKTGYTQGAGLCLATFAETEKQRYVLVTLGAGDGENYPRYNFSDAAILYDHYLRG